MPVTIRAVLNGESIEAISGTRLVDFLASRGVEGRLAIERNRELVPRARHAEIEIEEGDVFEIVHFVGGG